MALNGRYGAEIRSLSSVKRTYCGDFPMSPIDPLRTRALVTPHVCTRASSLRCCSAPDSAGAASVGARDHFQLVAVGVGKVDSASAIGVIDLAGTTAHWISPMVDAPFVDSVEDSVEICLADKEGIMLRSDWALGVGEVKRNAVVRLHHVEMAERPSISSIALCLSVS